MSLVNRLVSISLRDKEWPRLGMSCLSQMTSLDEFTVNASTSKPIVTSTETAANSEPRVQVVKAKNQRNQ